MNTNYDFYQKQKKRQRLKNVMAIGAAILLILFVFVASQYVETKDTKDAANNALISLNQDSFATLISSGKTTWSYKDSGTLPGRDLKGKNWKESGYEASGWKSGRGTFGAVEGKRTEQVEGKYPINLLNHHTPNKRSVPVYYFRTEFELKNPVEGLILNGTIQFDDAVVIYLNRKKIYEGNVPAEGFDSDGYGAEAYVKDSLTIDFSADNLTTLKRGRNVIAVEVHQADSNSSDVYFDFKSLKCQADRAEIDLADAASVILQPGDTEHSVMVNWLTKEKGRYKLQFAKKADFMKREIYKDVEMQIVDGDAKNAYCYTAAIEHMEPGAEYVYRIATDTEDTTSKQLEYKCRDTDDGFSFLLAGDPQIGAGNMKDDAAGWQRTLEAASSIDYHSASFIISAGDQVDSSDEQSALREYVAFRRPEILHSLPVAVVRGNHETDNNLYDLQFQRENQNEIHDYYFSYGNTLFVHLNSNNDEYREHRKFLEKAIDQTKPRWIVVMMHHSLFGSGPHAEDQSVRRARSYYAKCFQDLNVDLVVSGHDHLYSRSYLMNGNKSTGKDGGTKEEGETMYLTGNSSSGSKFYEKNIKQYGYLASLNAKKQSLVTFIKVSQSEMRITTLDTVHLDKIDDCKIRK